MSVEVSRNEFLEEIFTTPCNRIRIETVEGTMISAQLPGNHMLKEWENKTEKINCRETKIIL
jgi:hypothetical protein